MAIVLSLALMLLLPVPQEEQEKSLQVLFEEHVVADDMAGIDTLFRSRQYEIIFLIDGYLESWLAQMEAPPEEKIANPERLLELALLGAERADKTFGSESIGRYARAWQGWTAEQRAQFRQGQKEYGSGRQAIKEKRYEEARKQLTAASDIAEKLDDLWGLASAEQALGDLAIGKNEFAAAIRHHTRSRDVFAGLQHPGMLRSCRALAFVYEKDGNLAAARKNLEQMLTAAKIAGRSPERTAAVRADLSRICELLGDAEAAQKYREPTTSRDSG